MATKKTSRKKPTKAPATKAPATKAPAIKPAAKSSAKRPAPKQPGQDAPMSARLKEIVQQHDEIYGKGYFTPTKVKCPLCGDGVIVPKRGRFGAEWRCNADVKPMCQFKVDTKPNGKQCSFKRGGKPCGSLMVAGTKTIPDRCSDKSCPNRNPHKL